MRLSARNQLTGTVTSINEGAAIANIELEVNGQRLVASITAEAAHELGKTASRSPRSSRHPTSSWVRPTDGKGLAGGGAALIGVYGV